MPDNIVKKLEKLHQSRFNNDSEIILCCFTYAFI